MIELLPSHALADDAVLSGVARALGDLRRGALVLLEHEGRHLLVQAAEGAREAGLEALRRLSGSAPALLLTARRAAALGLEVAPQDDFAALALFDRPAERIVELADPTLPLSRPLERDERADPPRRLAQAAIDLVKLARLLPAALVAAVAPERSAAVLADGEILAVRAEAVAEYRFAGARSLVEVAAARVPLAGAEDATIRAFRPGDGGLENLAIVIGRPDPEAGVLVRLHSECFTGDLLGSLRCDCGDQLRGAIEAIAAEGAGVLLYLAQEGRGIGLVNKLRAYALQDRGADTAEANLQLGFDADERVYLPAAEMLRRLGIRRVRLLTNNPQKVAALERCGVRVAERVPHTFPDNRHNRPYLEAKQRRFGHLF
jgi:GTP cyclohydrolase II